MNVRHPLIIIIVTKNNYSSEHTVKQFVSDVSGYK